MVKYLDSAGNYALDPFQEWAVECRNLKPGDIVLVFSSKVLGKGDFKLGRILHVHKNLHDVVRTVTVGVRGKAGTDKTLPFVPRLLNELVIGVHSLAVICPVEEQ